MINSVTLIGRLGKDPELQTTEAGTSKATFPLAFHEYCMKNGERQTVTHWFTCVAFGPLAELCAEFTHKGCRVGVHGSLQQRSWVDKDGKPAQSVEIRIDDIEFVSNGRGE